MHVKNASNESSSQRRPVMDNESASDSDAKDDDLSSKNLQVNLFIQ